MTQDILTYISLGLALLFILFRIYRTISAMFIRKESACTSCSCGTTPKNITGNRLLISKEIRI